MQLCHGIQESGIILFGRSAVRAYWPVLMSSLGLIIWKDRIFRFWNNNIPCLKKSNGIFHLRRIPKCCHSCGTEENKPIQQAIQGYTTRVIMTKYTVGNWESNHREPNRNRTVIKYFQKRFCGVHKPDKKLIREIIRTRLWVVYHASHASGSSVVSSVNKITQERLIPVRTLYGVYKTYSTVRKLKKIRSYFSIYFQFK